MHIFIENEAGTFQKSIYNEKTLELLRTLEVARAYPYPYGFIVGTTAEDGDNVDAFVLTEQPLKRGQIVECKPIGLMEQFENAWDKSKHEEEVDHNVLVVLKEEEEFIINEVIKEKLSDFVTHVFDKVEKNKTRIGRFLDHTHAVQYVEAHRDNPSTTE